MTLFRLKSAPFVLIEDDGNQNILPLLLELVQDERNNINLFCYEQPITLWRNIFKNNSNIRYHADFNTDVYDEYVTGKCSLIIDSINQMALCLGWNECLKNLKRLQSDPDVNRIIIILHRDCIPISSKLQTHLNHLVNVIISYDKTNAQKVWIKIKKGSKVLKSEELLSYYDTKTFILKLSPDVKHEKKDEEPEKPVPANLTTFKIEVDKNEKIHKYNLKLPYMSKIHEGESKVYYEPDAVDDWDEEDPDEDLDI